jgi:hypothetical protein
MFSNVFDLVIGKTTQFQPESKKIETLVIL